MQPYVALGAGLKETGHEVTLVTGKGFEAMPTLLFFFALVLAVSYWFVLRPDRWTVRWRGSRAEDGERRRG